MFFFAFSCEDGSLLLQIVINQCLLCILKCTVYACGFCRIEEQTITASDLITQDIDINEPVGNLKKLLEPRLQIALDGYDICLQDIHVGFFLYIYLPNLSLQGCV